MKKVLSITVAIALTLSAAAFPVCAAKEDETSAQAACTHSAGTTTWPQTTYDCISDSQHNVFLTNVVRCNSCNMGLSYSIPQWLRTEAHKHSSGGTYVGGNHNGDYTTHVNYFTGPCTICNGTAKWSSPSGCRHNTCIYPQ